MPQIIEFRGQEYEFPDAASWEQIGAFLKSVGQPATDEQEPAEPILRSSLNQKAARGSVYNPPVNGKVPITPAYQYPEGFWGAALKMIDDRESVTGSLARGAVGVMHGVNNMRTGAAQLAANLASPVIPDSWKLNVNKAANTQPETYRSIMGKDPKGALEHAPIWLGEMIATAPVGGGVNAVVNNLGIKLLPKLLASPVARNVVKGAASGAAFGAALPVDDPEYNYGWRKTKQIGTGAAIGGALPLVGAGAALAECIHNTGSDKQPTRRRGCRATGKRKLRQRRNRRSGQKINRKSPAG